MLSQQPEVSEAVEHPDDRDSVVKEDDKEKMKSAKASGANKEDSEKN